MTPQQQANVLNVALHASLATQHTANMAITYLGSKTGPPGVGIYIAYGGLTGAAGAVAEGQKSGNIALTALSGAGISVFTLPLNPLKSELAGEALNNLSYYMGQLQEPMPAGPGAPVVYQGSHGPPRHP